MQATLGILPEKNGRGTAGQGMRDHRAPGSRALNPPYQRADLLHGYFAFARFGCAM